MELRWETEIRASAERVTSRLLLNCATTTIEPGPLGTRYGKVTRFHRLARLDFEQPMTMRPRVFGYRKQTLPHTDAGNWFRSCSPAVAALTTRTRAVCYAAYGAGVPH